LKPCITQSSAGLTIQRSRGFGFEAFLDHESPAIDISLLKFSYPGGQAVLDIPELKVNRGEKVFIHGPSGSGKTTLLGVLSGILNADSGRVSVHGVDLANVSSRERDIFRGDHVGYIFQMFNLIPYLSVIENIVLPCSISERRKANLAGRNPEVAAQVIAKRLDISHLLPKSITELSVGEQQRVAAARALIGAPKLLIADEPTSALDVDHRDEFIALLNSVAEESRATVLFVSHDQSLARHFHRQLSLPTLNRAATLRGGRRP